MTDHRPLLSCLSIDTRKDGTGKRTRWSLELSTYEFDIFHKSGKHHQDADRLLRAPHADPPIFHPDEEDILIAGASCW